MVKRTSTTILSLCIILLAASCQAAPEESSEQSATAHISEATPDQGGYTCADIDAHWGNNWPVVIAAVDSLIDSRQACGDEPLLSKLYAAYFNYGHSLESSSDIESAVENYTNAFLIDSNRLEALEALIRLDALPNPTPAPCDSDISPLPDPSSNELPDESLYIRAQGNQLFMQDQAYKVQGLNYYPRHAPWHRFLLEADLAEVETELDLVKQAGFNTLRIFLWYEPLFTCQPEEAIPDETTFDRLDELIELASERELKLVVTLNDLPDLTFRPLYTDWERYDAQTTYIVRRYRNEPVILAWDLRNEGDLDYGARSDEESKFEQEEVIAWLAHLSELVRENDPYHLVTAGWWGDPVATSQYVDILSFHHWHDASELQRRISNYTQQSNKPILLEEIGYHSWQDAPQDQRDEEEQARLINEAIQITENEDIVGWAIWTAFDFVPEPGQSSSFEHFFGLWRSDLTPKPALSSVFAD